MTGCCVLEIVDTGNQDFPPIDVAFPAIARHRDAPVKHRDFSEFAQHNVGGFEVSVQHTARMCIANCVADRHECIQQSLKFQWILNSLGSPPMVVLQCLAQRLSAHKTHRVIRLLGFFVFNELVDRNDVGVFKLPGDLGFLLQPQKRFLILRQIGQHFLQSDLAIQLAIGRQPHLPQTSFSMHPRQRIAFSCPRISLNRITQRGIFADVSDICPAVAIRVNGKIFAVRNAKSHRLQSGFRLPGYGHAY